MHRLDHVALRVADLDASIAFYTEKIGLRLMFRELDPEHHEAFAFLELDGGNLELLQMLDEKNRPLPFSPPSPAPPYCPHAALGVDDLDAVLEKARRDGLALLKGPLEIPGKVRWLYLADPDQNVLEFVQWL
ncbi:MAG: VOC family protein [Candidatus Hydrogenedentes bacterium]|nr:VOC family protein [Candidatus Hydrogenedentota bacterium]